MVKTLHFALLFASIFVAFTPVFATKASTPLEIISKEACFCDAPPPDNFRITSIGGSFITLAWTVSTLDAAHQISVFKKNALGDWDSLDTHTSIPGPHFTINNLEPGSEYRFRIATECIDGEPSQQTKFIDGIVLIIDLAVAGRTPLHPVAVECSAISLDHEWVGFVVACTGCRNYTSNYFEFSAIFTNSTDNNMISNAQIKRSDLDNEIVAVDEANNWPTSFSPLLTNVWNPFRIDRLIDGGPAREKIGFVNVIIQPSRIELCADYDNLLQPWNPAYSFFPLVAEDAIGDSNLPQAEETRSDNNLILNDKIRAQSPFSENLNVFLPPAQSAHCNTIFRLINMSGQTVFKEQFESPVSQVAFPIGEISNGVYILHIETIYETQTIKVIKSE